MCLDPDTEGDTEIKRLFVGESELFGEQGQTNLCGHGFLIGFSVSDGEAAGPGGSPDMPGRATRESRKTGKTCYRLSGEAQTCSVTAGHLNGADPLSADRTDRAPRRQLTRSSPVARQLTRPI